MASPLDPCWNGKKVDANCRELSADPLGSGSVGPCPACVAEDRGVSVPSTALKVDGWWVYAEPEPPGSWDAEDSFHECDSPSCDCRVPDGLSS